MEGDVVGLCDTKRKTCAMTKDDDNALKRKRSVVMMGGGHGGMACMAQDYPWGWGCQWSITQNR
jgi:hypothetical protein